jgi:hypothetical protein
MFGIIKSASKDNLSVRNPCCIRLLGHHADISSLSFCGVGRCFANTTSRLTTGLYVRTVFQHIKTGEQKSSTKVASIDAAVYHLDTSLYPLRLQRFSQLAIAPPAVPHPPLHQQARFVSPFRHGLRFGLYRYRIRSGQKRQGATYPVHFTRLFLGGLRRQLESILTHSASCYLYLCPHLVKATHA